MFGIAGLADSEKANSLHLRHTLLRRLLRTTREGTVLLFHRRLHLLRLMTLLAKKLTLDG